MTGLVVSMSTLSASAAEPDHRIEWRGVSHIGAHDRLPTVPLRTEPFRVRFQTLDNDLTAASVRQFVAGAATRMFEAAVVDHRGPYAIWEAELDGRDVDQLQYDIEMVDGNDVDYLGPDGPSDDADPANRFTLDFVTLSHAPLGATPTSDGVVFRVWAPNAPSAYVRGSFNNWSLTNPMTRLGEDFIALVPEANAGDAYRFYFDATNTWKSDPLGRRILTSSSNNSVVVDPSAYVWTSGTFTPPPKKAMVCYELHIGTFAGLNDPFGSAPTPSRFVDLTARVDHLAELGVNVAYLNPVIEWPGASSGGYNPLSIAAIEAAMGTPEEFQEMVDALHARGIAVVLDVVYNHFDSRNHDLSNFTGPTAADNIFFDSPPASTPWGPQLDLDRDRVREIVMEAILMLFEEYRIDGLRVDALSAFSWGPQPDASNELMRTLNDLVKRRYSDKLIIAEVFGDDPWFTRSTSDGGLGFHTQYHTAYKDAVRGATLAGISARPVAEAAAKMSGELQGLRVFNYFELHDDAWPLNGNQRAVVALDSTAPHDSPLAVGRTKLAHAVTLLARGVPAILHGSEWLEDNGWQYFKIDWSHKTTYRGVFDFYRDLIHLRSSRPALFTTGSADAYHINDARNIFAFERWEDGGESFVVVANFSGQSREHRIGLPRDGRWRVAMNSDETRYFGGGDGSTGMLTVDAIAQDGFAQSTSLTIPSATLLLLWHEPGRCTGDFNGDDIVNLGDLALILSQFGETGPAIAADMDADNDVDLGDLGAFLAVFGESCAN
ncbi:MAG: alpha amylase C-terminal domain-containing protein [Phycisphaerales bacterium]|nr:alpha amylase C-terminal domain-containing protein [Phycisphaerales bacterium]